MITKLYPPADADRIRLLLVDSDIKFLELTSQLLSRRGYIVTPATGSGYAITILNNNYSVFDVVIIDLCMPGIDGIELAIMIKEISTNMPIILHTGKFDLINENDTAKVGIAEIICKPYRIDELDELIKKVINKPMEE